MKPRNLLVMLVFLSVLHVHFGSGSLCRAHYGSSQCFILITEQVLRAKLQKVTSMAIYQLVQHHPQSVCHLWLPSVALRLLL